jgi:hypothetical protein
MLNIQILMDHQDPSALNADLPIDESSLEHPKFILSGSIQPQQQFTQSFEKKVVFCDKINLRDSSEGQALY